MTASVCALCDKDRECVTKEIEGREYNICPECWRNLAEILKGKGRLIERHSPVTLDPPDVPREEPAEKPFPGTPPKVWLSE